MSTLSITPQQIINHRATRKAAGLVGCITGRPEPEMNFFGYSDVQSWRPADPMKPHCFCFDCRELWDNDASIDLQLILDGHRWARETYAELLPMDMRPENPSPPSLRVPLPTRTNGGGIPLPPRINTEQPSYGSFDEIPTSLPAPRARDIMNESSDERLRMDLAILRGKLQSDLVVVMDRRRNAICYDNPIDRSIFLAGIGVEEEAITNKLAAIDLLLNA